MSASPAPRRPREIFLAALEIGDEAERDVFVREACNGDTQLRQMVSGLLAERRRMGDFLESPAAQLPCDATPAPPADGDAIATPRMRRRSEADLDGKRIDHYRILEKLGEGGCGTVYLAEQDEPIRRRVALKVIKPGMDTQAVITRFEGERQALALMDHPGIARVLDAGTTDHGRPYFVMELVRGPRITQFCDENRLPLRPRLELFIRVCHAIQHAHQKGVIHRDIKPSNILVMRHDGEPIPKVIDFGIAKAIEQPLTENTQVTSLAQFLGTPAYVSPEQAEMSGHDLDTRSDLYSLGVLLYELLTGAPPFDGRQLLDSGFDAMRQTIREVDPPRPSSRLASLPQVSALPIAQARGCDPTRWLREVRGDLDWIVMRAIAKDRQLRYETASALAADLQRFLQGEEVSARPPTRRYRLAKFVQRNRGLVSAGVAILAILLLATAATSWQAVRATRAEFEQSRLRDIAEDAQRAERRQRERAESERLAALHRAYNSDMNLVQQALQANNYGRAVDLLERHHRITPPDAAPLTSPIADPDPDLRHWEWRYFRNLARSEALGALPKQERTLNSLALSRDGRHLVSIDRVGNVIVWDVNARRSLAEWRSGGRAGATAASHADNRIAFSTATGGRRSSIQIWSADQSMTVASLDVDAGVLALSFSADGSTLRFACDDLTLRTWQPTENSTPTTEPLPLRREQGYWQIQKATFSDDGLLLACAVGGRVHLIDARDARLRHQFDTAFQAIASLAFAPDASLLAVGPSFLEVESTIRLFNVVTGQPAGQLAGHASWIPDLVFSADGTRLFSASADQTIRSWDLLNRTEAGLLRGHLSEVNCLVLSADGQTLVSGCKDGTLFLWDARRTGSTPSFERLPTHASGMEFSGDGRTLYTFGHGSEVHAWSVPDLRELASLTALGREVDRLVINSDGSRLYAGTRGPMLVFEGRTRTLSPDGPVQPAPRRSLQPVALLDHDRFLLTEELDGPLRLWDTQTWQSRELRTPLVPRRSPWDRSIFSPAQQLLVQPGPENSLHLIDLATGLNRATLTIEFRGSAGLRFSPDGTLLAAASRGGLIYLYHSASGELADAMRGHLLGVHDVAFSPDGLRLASASAKSEAVKIWDVRTRHEVASLAGEGSLFNRVHFSPEGSLVLAINSSGTVHVWRAPELRELDRIAAREAAVSAPESR